MTKDEMLEVLRNGIATVEFTKTNGETRTMRASLLKQYLPEDAEVLPETPRQLNDNIVACWDVEKDGWRSFRVNSVTRFERETNNV